MIKSSTGAWFIDNCIIKSSDDEVIADVNETHIYNAKAIAAVPELLSVYKAARKLKNMAMFWAEDQHIIDSILEAIDKLEERHCKSIKDVENNERI